METTVIQQIAAEVTGAPANPGPHETRIIRRVAKALGLILAGQVESVYAAADIWRVRGTSGVYTVQDGRCNCRYQKNPSAAAWSCAHSMAVYIVREATYRQAQHNVVTA